MKSQASRFLSIALLAIVCGMIHPAKTAAASQSSPSADDQKIAITRSNAIPTAPGPADHFVGAVKMDTQAAPHNPSHTRVLTVSFAPGAYTAWHSHPLGQILIVTSGSGFVQQWGGPIQQIHTGDVIWTPPNVKHWHGAGPNGPMAHISIYDEPEGQVTKWMEKVAVEDYQKAK